MKEKNSQPVIDAHFHVLPEKVFSAVRDWFEREAGWNLPDLTIEEAVEQSQKFVDGMVFFPYAHRPGVAASMNRDTLRWQERLEEKEDFDAIGLGTVHAGDEKPRQIVEEALDPTEENETGETEGLNGLKIHCPVQGFSPDDPRLDPVYELLVEDDYPLVIHASSHPFYRDSEILGPEKMRNVLERYPSLRVCVAHIGLFETSSFLDLAEEYEVYFDTAVAVGEKTHQAIGVREDEFPNERVRTNSDRIMFGTDYPTLPTAISYSEAIESVEDFFEETENVFYENAKKFYF